MSSPALWGTRAWLQKNFGPNARTLSLETKKFVFRYKSPAHFMDIFRTYYGPIHKAFLALDPAGQAALAHDLEELIARLNVAEDGSMKVPSEYAEVAIVKA